jgi:hypothetical protein
MYCVCVGEEGDIHTLIVFQHMFYVLVTLPKMEQYSCSVGGGGGRGEDDRTIIDI